MKERGKKKRKKKKGKKGKPPRQSLSLVCFVHEKKDSRIHRAARMKKPYIFVRNDKTIDLSAIEGDPRFRTDFEPSGLLNFQDRHSFPRGKDIYIYIYGRNGGKEEQLIIARVKVGVASYIPPLLAHSTCVALI